MELLIKKFIEGKLNDKEEDILYHWVLENKANAETLKKEITAFERQHRITKEFELESAFEELNARIENKNNSGKFRLRQYYKYAAALVLLVTTSYFFLDDNSLIKEEVLITNDQNMSNEKIVISSDNGKSRFVDDTKKKVSYLNQKSETETLVYHNIIIPKGRVFKLILSDSTVVWLNADTQLRYPSKFSKIQDTRSVFLKGEAYFEVAHNANKPFIVYTDNVKVNVLGTKFNISSYADEESINTTLVEGAVQVTDVRNDQNAMLLSPSHQASFNAADNQFLKKKVDTYLFTSWIEKKIIFQETPFKELLRKIERTYRVKVENNNTKINSELFTGQFDVEDVEMIFKALSTSLYFEYEISGNHIVIK